MQHQVAQVEDLAHLGALIELGEEAGAGEYFSLLPIFFIKAFNFLIQTENFAQMSLLWSGIKALQTLQQI